MKRVKRILNDIYVYLKVIWLFSCGMAILVSTLILLPLVDSKLYTIYITRIPDDWVEKVLINVICNWGSYWFLVTGGIITVILLVKACKVLKIAHEEKEENTE